MSKHSIKIAGFGIAAFFCLSGQMPREEVQEVPSTQYAITAIEIPVEAELEPPKEIKSAAKKSMEDHGHTTMNRKSAARRAMEREQQY